MRLGLSHRVLPRVGCLGVGLLPGRRQNLLGRWPVPCLHDSCSTEEAEFSCCLVLLWGRLCGPWCHGWECITALGFAAVILI